MSFDFAAARLTMIDSQVRTNDVPDFSIQTAMGAAPVGTIWPMPIARSNGRRAIIFCRRAT